MRQRSHNRQFTTRYTASTTSTSTCFYQAHILHMHVLHIHTYPYIYSIHIHTYIYSTQAHIHILLLFNPHEADISINTFISNFHRVINRGLRCDSDNLVSNSRRVILLPHIMTLVVYGFHTEFAYSMWLHTKLLYNVT